MRKIIKNIIVSNPKLGHILLFFIRPIFNLHPSMHSMRKTLYLMERQGFSPQVIWDVGAHLGEWGRLAKSVFADSQIILFEPLLEMKPFLDNFCKDYSDCKWYQLGLGNESKNLTLYITEDFASSSLLQETGIASTNSGVFYDVEVAIADDLIEKHNLPRPDLVKIDVQGFELEVLKGCKCCFGQTEAFIIEVSNFRFLQNQPIFHEIVEFMADNGYVLYDVIHLKPRFANGVLGQMDVCFVKEDGILRNAICHNKQLTN